MPDGSLPDLRIMHVGRIDIDRDPVRGLWRLMVPGLDDVFCKDEKDALGVARVLSFMVSHTALIQAREGE